MKFEREECTFEIPDRPTIRQQMSWFSLAYNGLDAAERLDRNWNAAKTLITVWECPSMPDINAIDVDKMTQPTQAAILMWAGTQVYRFIDNLDDIPKNE